MSQMKFEILTVTPEMAEAWFAKNEGNRKLREQRAAGLARAIIAGKYRLTHQPIAISSKGRLLDGQHRLRAVILANKPIKSAVAFDVPESAFEVMDAGMPRKMFERLRSDPRHTAVCSTMFRLLQSNRVALEYETNLLLDILGPALLQMDQVPRAKGNKVVGKSSQEGAFALRMAQAIKDQDEDAQIRINWILGKLRRGDMVGADPIVVSYYRQLAEGVKHDLAVAPVTDQFVRAWVALDPGRAAATRLQINDHSAEVRDAREAFRDVTQGVFDE